jgi:hypothetical protein
MLKQARAVLAVRVAGVIFVGIGLSHFIVPTLFKWGQTLPESAIAVVAGETINNVRFLYLFNADLLLYETMLGLLSLYFAPRLRTGDRSALVFTTAIGAFFLLRTPVQFLYFPPTWSNLLQAAVSFVIACLYGYPLLVRKSLKQA